MNPYIDRDTWTEFFKESTITDCAIRDRNIVYVCARQELPPEEASLKWNNEIPTFFVAIYLDTPDDNHAVVEVSGVNKPRLGVSNLPAAHGLLVSRSVGGQVVAMGPDTQPEESIDPDGVPMTNKVKTLFGYAYSVGSDRQIYRRVQVGQWQKIADLPEGDDVAAIGFNDLDAFAENDMYAVGGRGDVWHFNGSSWQQKGFPSNVTLATVTCAGDGKVYITGEGGSIWVGRDSTWKQVYQGRSTILWNDVLWFEGKLWLASDYQFRVWNGDSLVLPQTPAGDEILMSGHMDVRDGLLAIASTAGVMTFDGQAWRTIVAPYE